MKNNYPSIILIVVATALIVGGTAYLLQNSFFSSKIQAQKQQIEKLQNQIVQLQVQEKNTATEEEQPIKIESALGYIKAIYEQNKKRYLDIDYIQWLSNSNNTCYTLGTELPGIPQCNPNGFLIVNQNPKIRTFEILKDVEIQMQTFSNAPDGDFNWGEKINYEQFKEIFNPAIPRLKHLRDAPYHLNIKNDVIISIIQQYTP